MPRKRKRKVTPRPIAGLPQTRQRKPLRPPLKLDTVSWHLGIDPGVTGAWVVVELDPDRQAWQIVHCQDLPVKSTQRNNKTHNRIDALALSAQIAPWQGLVDSVTVEQVFAPPGISSTIAFSLGLTAGLVDVALDMLPDLTGKRRSVPPRSWKTPLGLSADKEATRQAAARFFGPAMAADYFPRKKDHNRAEAALLAVWSALNPAHVPVSEPFDPVKAAEKPTSVGSDTAMGSPT